MATEIKTTVTFTFSFTSIDDKSAIRALLDWMGVYQSNKPDVTCDCESGKYTIADKCTIANSFSFDNVAEFAQKYGTYFSAYELARAMMEYGSYGPVTAKTESIEVEDE